MPRPLMPNIPAMGMSAAPWAMPQLPQSQAPWMQPPALPAMQSPFDVGQDQFDYGGFGGQRAEPPPTELTEEEQKSLGQRLLGGLQWAGETIDKPFAATRALMVGDLPAAIENLIPFSDTVASYRGVDPAKRYSGRDVLEKWGALDANEEGLDWGDVAGLGLELLTPAPIIGGPMKAITALGKAKQLMKSVPGAYKTADEALDAVKAGSKTLTEGVGELAATGKLAKTPHMGTNPLAVGEEIANKERGLLRLGVSWPWSNIPGLDPGLVIGKGETAAKVWDALHYGNYSPIRGVRALVDKGLKAGGATIFDPEVQRAADMMYHYGKNLVAMEEDMKPAAASMYKHLGTAFEEIKDHLEIAGQPASKMLWDEMSMSLAQHGDNLAQAAASGAPHVLDPASIRAMAVSGAPQEAVAKIAEFSDQFASYLNDALLPAMNAVYDARAAMGGKAPSASDIFIPYFTRHASKAYHSQDPEALQRALMLGTSMPEAIGRIEAFRNIPRGLVTINRGAREAMLAAPFSETAAKAAATPGSGAFAAGTVVHASDRNNYGWVLGGKGNKSLVEFHGSSGEPTRVTLSNNLLTEAKNVPAEVAALAPPMPQTAAQQEAALRNALGTLRSTPQGQQIASMWNAPNMQTATLDELKGIWWREHELIPGALEKGVQPGSDEFKMLIESDILPLSEASNPVYQQGVLSRAGVDVTGKTPKQAAKAFEDALEQQGYVWNGEQNQWFRPSKADQLAKYFGSRAATREGVFNQGQLRDWAEYMDHGMASVVNLQTIHSLLGRAAKPMEDGLIPLKEVWNGVTTSKGRRTLTDDGLQTFLKNNPGVDPDKFGVPQEVAKAIKTFMDFDDPSKAHPLLKLWDGWQRATKTALTTIWPAFHARNRVGGIMQNVTADGPYSLKQYAKAEADFARFVATKGKHAPEYMEEAELLGILKGHANASDAQQIFSGEREVEKLGGGPLWALSPLASPSKWNPLNLVRKGKEFAPLETGKRMYELVEQANRYAPYAASRAAGYTPSQAKSFVEWVQYSYQGGTAFEKNVMRRIFPWWGWMRSNIPYQLGQLINNPGGKGGAMVRALNSIQGQSSGYMPVWLRERMGIRLPGGEEKNASVLRQFGLPVEDLNNVLTGVGGGPRAMAAESAMRLASQMDPTITMLMKLVGGKDLYSGRNIKDMEGVTGNPILDTILMSSPVSRGIRTAMDLAKEGKPAWAKALDVGTGVKIGNYDLEKQKMIEYRNLLSKEMEANPDIRQGGHYYVNPQRAKNMTPEQLAQVKAAIRKVDRIGKGVSAIQKKRDAEEKMKGA